ncbi:hypothetical protein PF005_g11175 [Phytophthora fragariae]|uniref:Pectate lyase n=1 Tax=Phytophthora fragariae TaxID=53985 RepID=A0A6A3SKZ1_9STRA|nr:hypothetical protein PF003_g1490 [Phytophthora fragariae]KAE8940832.1 hypothetical protein PF009_g9374 [Phytophthora fragariae]KAE9119290.1 hypothetical protein PF007_g8604 [Phytophthora fragariae]KAE9143038.1 hypothetical protein PF006_g11907 [Phytophthora fragariae]KAE9210994.1 hypothetical protein PF005_g11175 [Phytophthora fragariae]
MYWYLLVPICLSRGLIRVAGTQRYVPDCIGANLTRPIGLGEATSTSTSELTPAALRLNDGFSNRHNVHYVATSKYYIRHCIQYVACRYRGCEAGAGDSQFHVK